MKQKQKNSENSMWKRKYFKKQTKDRAKPNSEILAQKFLKMTIASQDNSEVMCKTQNIIYET